ncbi:MAG: AAA family ATPase [Candidatus Cloacimonetes bacterium]|nr:AAA family ATPase [Candidatus Cloacimonadota bacterium]MBL7087061.1 AAA family ATPase [Candidatus Cloacimonadota bacterium]
MNLINYFQKYNLTNDQDKLVDKLNSFLISENQYFILKGYAGTGKTFLMKGLTEYLTLLKRHYRIAAPTGRAAKIIFEKTKQEAYTIHKMIYSETILQEVEDKGKIESLKFYFDLHLNDDPINTIYIIDEASMISNIKDESEFLSFGSGHLLKDLITYVNPNSKSIKRKIIFIGDSAQLPPINMSYSPALSIKYIHKNFGGQATQYELKEVVRHKAESGILNNATYIRNSISKKIQTELNISESSDVVHLKTKNLLSSYLSESKSKISKDQIIIAHSNYSVKEFNDLIRNHYFPDIKIITKNDLILITKNNYNYSIDLFNGDFGKVFSVEFESETKNIIFKRKDKNNVLQTYNISLTFRNVGLIFQDLENNNHLINCKIIENLLYSKYGRLTSEEQIALYVDFKKRNSKLKPGTKEFKDELKADPYFNALQIKFGYAVTCNKAQGGEWNTVYVDCNAKMGKSNSTYFRWLYTAITRAKNKLYTLNTPHYTAGSKMKISNNQDNSNIIKSIIIDHIPQENINSKFSFDDEFQKSLYLLILQLIDKLNIDIEDIRHKQFCEHYYFSNDSKRTLILLYYNNKNMVTKILANEDSDSSDSLIEELRFIINKEIIIKDENPESINNSLSFEFPAEFPFLNDLYENICSKIKKENIIISDIKHLQWRERYRFTNTNYKVIVDFIYNKKGEFKFSPNAKDSNSKQLLEKITELMGSL